MFDLHSHILPGVDDGAKTVDDALEMARVAAEDGTQLMLCTPHRKDVTEGHSVQHIETLVDQMNEEIQSQNIPLTLVLGMENHLDLDLPDEFIEGRALRMNGSRYALVEFPFFGRPNYMSDVLFQIQLQGITPVLAHPERIEAIQSSPDLLARLVRRGMLTQVTAGSVVGHFGSNVKKVTHQLLRRGLVHIVASDTHFPNGPRSPVLTEGVAAAALIVGEEAARRMVFETPKAILGDDPVDLDEPVDVRNGRSWWRFWVN